MGVWGKWVVVGCGGNTYRRVGLALDYPGVEGVLALDYPVCMGLALY